MTYKGFDKNMKCRGFQYEIGGEYTEKGKIRACSNGFHACAVPLDAMSYYPPGDSRYCEVEQSGTMRKGSDDSKVASEKIKIGAEIGLTGLIKAQIAYVAETCKGVPEKIAQGYRGHAAAQGKFGHAAAQGYGGHAAAQGDRGHAAAQGDYGHAATQGYGGHAAAQGNMGHAEVGGKDAIAAAFGIEGKARAALGSWIMCAEWVYTDAWHIKDVRAAQIDGEKLKPDTWYMLKDGEFVEAEENE
nr:MAG TPA: hypothetical protein [Caudoviricetes sp.]